MAGSLDYSVHQYGTENYLQRLGVWGVDFESKSKYWIIYIHGGAWRDPRVDFETFAPTIDRIISSQHPLGSAIAAFASLDYRLGPHPLFPQDPASTPASQYRNAKHPDHLNDIRSALSYLQKRYAFGSNYVLVGHSAGACLAFQLIGSPENAGLVLPQAIVGFEGIYDFTGINSRYRGGYAEFLTGAFGDPSCWDSAAPMKFPGSLKEGWNEGKLAALGWSRDDPLIDEPEIDGMTAKLERDGVKLVLFKDLHGGHDELWENGADVARMILTTLDAIYST
ncbi:hypothetical protein DL768_005231 [Monosporascus sp. mg162]|nr:hypothetical protein DL768_005231 [Monosporascus sp. mg162]